MIEKEIVKSIENAERIAILPHVFADGDALGSSIALALALRKIGKQVKVYIEEEIPHTFEFLPGREYVEVYRGQIEDYDLVLILDTGDLERLGKRVEIFNSIKHTVNIDHHTTNTEFASVNLVNTKAAAVGELIYQLIKSMEISLDQDISTCLYVAVATDTGGFRYSNTTALTHQITADLINNGVDVSKISQIVFETVPYKKVKLMGLAIDTIEISENGKLAFISVTEEMMKKTDASEEDCDGLVNIARNIEGVEVAVLVRQRSKDEFKINFRSQNYVDVSAIARKYSGGGHMKAAGCTLKGNMEEIKQMLKKDIKEVL
ncbi:DHH family phosphoesterase [Acetivibrio clariflavus]|uniref:Exopolyphosphatase-like enzyme n=1 Tax=Acetivibrio clariflavus (strain DSM 19732 / NBRC 101661 / EBR45) TaxID=720554 RepID=G8LZT6_ACECE|nr:bifunctional oligoribonuclease/PAP phosphatase NrnA [Acetivibrio clariflavus]AEV69026.1 exopolyphosphatase-like enzyme [Acetivibrio clariflavus DSM 19732]